MRPALLATPYERAAVRPQQTQMELTGAHRGGRGRRVDTLHPVQLHPGINDLVSLRPSFDRAPRCVGVGARVVALAAGIGAASDGCLPAGAAGP